MATNAGNNTLKAPFYQRNYLFQAWLVISLALVFGLALAAVQGVLGPKIEANKINETKEKIPELVVGRQGAENMAAHNEHLLIAPRTILVEAQGIQKPYAVYEARYPDGRSAGWVAKANGVGYADRIELLVGLAPQADKLTGVFILDQKETPGLGNKIVEPVWRDQFIDKATDRPLEVVKGQDATGSNRVNAISGATISSRSVVAIVNTAITDLKSPLTAQAAKGQKE